MANIACRSNADLKPLNAGLSVEVLDWVDELRIIWSAAGLSMNEFASLHPIDKGTISRYLNGKRVPRDRWFLDKLLAIQADNGQPVTTAVREHLTGLHLRALKVAHPQEYRVRLVNDELEIALTGKLEAERYARSLEGQLAERSRQVRDLTDDKGRLRAAWDADRVVIQAEHERLTREIAEITGQLNLTRERAVQAEWRCRKLEDLLNRLETPSSEDEDSTGARYPLNDPSALASQRGTFWDMGWGDDLSVPTGRAADHVSVSDVRQLVRQLAVMRDAGADLGVSTLDALQMLEAEALAALLVTLCAVGADDVVRKLAYDVISCAHRFYGQRYDDRDMEKIAAVLHTAGADSEAWELEALIREQGGPGPAPRRRRLWDQRPPRRQRKPVR